MSIFVYKKIRSPSFGLFLPQHASPDVEKMILGNKCDANDKRQVSREQGEKVSATAWSPPWLVVFIAVPADPTNVKLAFVQLAASFGIKFMETSAKANINIENVSTATFLLFML